MYVAPHTTIPTLVNRLSISFLSGTLAMLLLDGKTRTDVMSVVHGDQRCNKGGRWGCTEPLGPW